jgi:hypothetical protein
MGVISCMGWGNTLRVSCINSITAIRVRMTYINNKFSNIQRREVG